MLVIISDIHLTDGSSGKTIDAQAFKVFRERLRDLAYDASWRPGGRYDPVKRIDLVLLGDILDVIRSTKWLEVAVRPWSAGDPNLATTVDSITRAILTHNHQFLDYVKSLQDPKVITLPPAGPNGKPLLVSCEPDAPQRIPVKVQVHYVIGNHDWFYHLPGTAFDAIRLAIVQAMGLANDPNQPFPYDVDSTADLNAACRKHQVFARHGDFFDASNFDGQRDASSLGDAIVIELLNRFPDEVQKQLGPSTLAASLRDVDNVRPLLAAPAWVDGLLRRMAPNSAVERQVKSIWDKLANDFLRLGFVQSHNKWYRCDDLVDKLSWALLFSRGASLREIDRVLSWCKGLFTRGDGTSYANALSEQAFKSRRAKYIVHGHTHHHEIVPLDTSTDAGAPAFDQMYLNSGTWRQVFELAQCHPDEHEFIGYQVMTYLAFFADGERGGRGFETWSGALATPAIEEGPAR